MYITLTTMVIPASTSKKHICQKHTHTHTRMYGTPHPCTHTYQPHEVDSPLALLQGGLEEGIGPVKVMAARGSRQRGAGEAAVPKGQEDTAC